MPRHPSAAAAALLEAAKDRAVLAEKRREALAVAGKLFAPARAEQQFLQLETALASVRFNGEVLDPGRAPKFRAVSAGTYLRRLILRPRR